MCVLNALFPQRFSVDLTHRADEVNIPLSTVEPDLQAESVPLNGLITNYAKQDLYINIFQLHHLPLI